MRSGVGTKTKLASFAALALALALVCLPTRAREQTSVQAVPKLKVNVTLVNLTATVINEAGRPVSDLEKGDFLVYEDGVPQEIAVFHNENDIPVSVGIVLDTSGSMVDKIDQVRDAVLHFIDTVNPDDDIFLMRFAGQALLIQDFTSDRQKPRQAIRQLRAEGWTSLYDAIVKGVKYLQGGRHRRKALLVITDGNDTGSEIELQQAVDFAIRSEVQIYCLGIGHGDLGSFGHRDGLIKGTVDVDVLRSFSNLTGGRTFVLQGPHYKKGVDQIDRACQQVATELRQQYTLAYYPRNVKKDREYRRIQVKVKDRKLKVRARDGYFTRPNQGEISRPD